MKIEQKEKIWSVLCKYEQTLGSFCDSLSKVIQEKSNKSDYITIFRNFNNLESGDVLVLDSILGQKIMISVNS
jgi:hypothetical protein